MYRGKIIAMVPAEEATKEYIGLLMAGVKPDTLEKPVKRAVIETTF